MNGKQFGILLVLVVLLGGGGLMIYSKRGGSWSNTEATSKKLLGEFQVNDVAQITVRNANDELNLVKKDDLWRVRERGDYPAEFGSISRQLLKLRDLKVIQTEQIGASQLPRLELAPLGSGSNTATLIELRDTGGKVIKSLLLGKKHMQKGGRPSQSGDTEDAGWPDGRYVMKDASSTSVALISDPLSEIEPKPESWLNKDFIKVEKPRSISATLPEATNSWKVSRETDSGEWKLADAKADEHLDTSKASSFSYALSSPAFADVITDAKPEQTGLDKPATIVLETFDNFTYTINVGAKTNDNCYLTVAVSADLPKERAPGKDEKPEDKEKLDKEFKERQQKLEEKLKQEKSCVKWTYLVSNWTTDSLLKPRAELMAVKEEETKGSKPATEEPKTVEKTDDKTAAEE